MGKLAVRTKFITYYVLALSGAFYTYRGFLMFRGDAAFSIYTVMLNTFILLAVWFFSFTGKSGFVSKNRGLLIFAPLLSIYGTDFFIHSAVEGTSISGLLCFTTASFLLIFFSHRVSVCEEKLD